MDDPAVCWSGRLGVKDSLSPERCPSPHRVPAWTLPKGPWSTARGRFQSSSSFKVQLQSHDPVLPGSYGMVTPLWPLRRVPFYLLSEMLRWLPQKSQAGLQLLILPPQLPNCPAYKSSFSLTFPAVTEVLLTPMAPTTAGEDRPLAVI